MPDIPADQRVRGWGRKLRRASKLLNDLLEDVREVYPDAGLYVTPDNLHLLSGPSHDGGAGIARQDRVLANEPVPGLDGGDW